MPRRPIDLDFSLESLSILDDEGNLDSSLEPDLERDQLLRLYEIMLLTRRLDEHMLRLQRQGRIGTFAPVKGQEAAHVGSTLALRDSDWMVPSFRETGAMLLRGWPISGMLLYFAGYEEGAVPPQGVKDLPICVPVTSQLPHAVGIAWAAKLKKDPVAVLCFFGDGATSEGDFHESLNFASVYQLPVVFFCQNNQWAISLPIQRQTHSRTLAQKALGFEIPALRVDGNDALAAYSAAREALERARAGGGPTLIEALTYRLSVHTTADDPKRYRSDEEVTEWEKKDPLPRLDKLLRAKGILDDHSHAELEETLQQRIRNEVEKAEGMMQAAPLEMFDYTFETLTARLREQREELQSELSEQKRVSAQSADS